MKGILSALFLAVATFYASKEDATALPAALAAMFALDTLSFAAYVVLRKKGHMKLW